ncbi:MAG: inorganic pyrophosphatase [Chromatiales bacterium]|jgi:inorganic pyrophosphatase|nr:inorganic pyrophosphatase [Chromatiales bacterium]
MDERRSFHTYRSHPWHGLAVGPRPPRVLNAYIEITPFDLVKYELDKDTGFMAVDRPQLTSSLPPTLYGFVPRTYCGAHVSKLMPGATKGDGDPLDICVLSERPITRCDILMHVNVVGGLPMLDGGEADDKIIAVLNKDALWGKVDDIADIPKTLVDRLRHYFCSYKAVIGSTPDVEVGEAYGRVHAERVIAAAMQDYEENFGKPED